MALPKGYFSIAEAKKVGKGDLVSLIGVPVDFQHPKQSRGKDFMCTLNICDQSAAVFNNNLMLRLFKENPEELPQDIAISDDAIIVVVLKTIKMGVFRDEPVGMSNYKTEWIVLKGDIQTRKAKGHLPPPRPRMQILSCGPKQIEDQIERSKLLSENEYKACQDLVEAWHARGRLAGCHGVTKETYNTELDLKENRKKKLAQIKDIQENNFHDIICFVQDKWVSSHGQQTTVYVTDFTQNMDLYHHNNDFLGLSEETVQEEAARDETYSYAYDFGGATTKKAAKSGFVSKWYYERLGFYTLPVIFWDSLSAKADQELKAGEYILLNNVNIKRDAQKGKLEGNLRLPRDTSKPMSDGFVKIGPSDARVKGLNTRRNELERTTKEKKEAIIEARKRRAEEEKQKKLEEEMNRRRENNPLILCGYESMETTTIKSINVSLEGTVLDFFNRHYRTECRVKEFRPPDIKYFCQPIKDDPEACSLPLDVDPRPKWFWCFELDVVGKDEESFITIQVDDAAGRHLLTMDPCDLQDPANHEKLEQLRHELSILWGNLDEVIRDRQERFQVCQNHMEMVLDQYIKNPYDKPLQKAKFKEYEAERDAINKLPVFNDNKISNKFFFAMIKEYGEPYEEDDGKRGFERKFILEHTMINSKNRAEKVKLLKQRKRRQQEGAVQEASDRMDLDQSLSSTL
ncbi:hypothetical protein Dda_4721 [Drechslerella dactyloides]|uniref:Protection of telomeres protein 1 n=1 Tax=Drechslerella dactyloides TaxID=74499 RepID=A0AAD6IXF9_DREDA|nr:hypothetical protein Dda_4721 [Drechslerella dactyloides]